jgi:hypothetical protein
MSSNVVSGIDKYKASQVAHGVQQISVATVISNVAGGPKIDVKDVEGTAKGPGEDKFTVAGDGTVDGDAMRTLEHPVGNVFATLWPEESEADAVKSLVDAHVPSRRRGVVGGEDVTSKREWDDNQHKHFLVVLHWLEDDQFTLDDGDAVTTNIIAISRIDGGEIRFGDGRRRGQAVKKQLSVGVLLIGGEPIEWRRNGSSGGDGVDVGASDELGGRISGIDGSE